MTLRPLVPGVVLTMLCLAATRAPAIDGAPVGSDACVVAAADLEAWRSRPGLVVVDTRPEPAFRSLRIPGSVHVPAFALKTKSYLRSRPLLLVDARGSNGLVAACGKLRASGFAEVGALEGGIAHWARRVGDLVGDRSNEPGLLTLPAGELVAGLPGARWLIVDTGPRDAGVERRLAGAMVRIPLDDERAFRAAVERAVRKRGRGGTVPHVVLVDAAGANSHRLRRLAGELDVPHAFVLEGGLAGYRHFVDGRDGRMATAGMGCGAARCGGR